MNSKPSQFINYEFPNELKYFNDRELRWLWNYMSQTGAPLPLEATVQPSDRKQALANMLARANDYSSTINDILQQEKNMLIPLEHFGWIDRRDERQMLWVLSQCNDTRNGLMAPALSIVSSADRFSEIVFAFDRWNVYFNDKINHLNHLKSLWTQIRTPDQQTKWIDKKNEDQLTWAWNYLVKYHKTYPALAPSNNKETYSYILFTLDNAYFEHISEKQIFIEKMKKTWSQKKYRDSGNAKKQNYIPMTKTTREKLDEIVDHEGQKIADVVKALIDEKYDAIFA